MGSALDLSKALQLIEFINFMNPIPKLSSGVANSLLQDLGAVHVVF